MMSLSQQLKEVARELGFSLMGIAPARSSPRLDSYLQWIENQMHGAMAYMARPDRVERRRDLNLILPGARSLIVVALDYSTTPIPAEILTDPSRGRISNYAWGADYHTIMLARLEQLIEFLRNRIGDALAARAFVDYGPLLERDHAEQAGLGFIGKNTMLIHPRRGSFMFLGEILTSAELDYDTPNPHLPTCGSCTHCLTACPTSAFPAPYVLDATRCISYLTIELKDFIPRLLRPLMSNWIYGCDICQTVCPWQRFAQTNESSLFAPVNVNRAAPPLTDLLSLTDQDFTNRFAGSAIQRIGRDRLVRNACVAAGNGGLIELVDLLLPLLRDTSPLVRGHAAWAVARIGDDVTPLSNALCDEVDEHVREEMQFALAEHQRAK